LFVPKVKIALLTAKSLKYRSAVVGSIYGIVLDGVGVTDGVLVGSGV
jgi:hypothetical protein